MTELKAIIEAAFEDRENITPSAAPADVKQAVSDAIALLNSGEARVAEKIAGEWVVHQWLKKAVLLYFRLHNNGVMEGAESSVVCVFEPFLRQGSAEIRRLHCRTICC